MATQHTHITLVDLQRQVKASLDERFPLPIWISAEISELKVNASGHCYIDLVEKGTGDGTPQAQARAVIWRTAFAKLAAYFEAEAGQKLTRGLKILAKVVVNYHELYGFSLQITDLDPSYTLGDMERQRQMTIAQLQKEGVWTMNREITLPFVLQRIAVVSSANAAGYQDFCKEISQSPYRFQLTLFDAFMQGAAAEASIVEALEQIATTEEAFDAVVIIRGGGSASDLNCFNAYRICSYIAQFPIPVITGIGHDKDNSVADMVAHTALKTPTAVAGWLVERMVSIEGWLDNAALQLQNATATLTHGHELRLEQLNGKIESLSSALIARCRFSLENYIRELPLSTQDFIQRQLTQLTANRELIESRSPAHVLKLGFSIARVAGKAITSTTEVSAGTPLFLEVSDGQIETIVK
ncbi:MAG: exodeoxyribonuclease VII large subunit [Alistipes sp.]